MLQFPIICGIGTSPAIRKPLTTQIKNMSKLLVLAILLLVVWVVLKVALAITSVSLHLMWIVAIVLAILWVVGKIRGPK